MRGCAQRGGLVSTHPPPGQDLSGRPGPGPCESERVKGDQGHLLSWKGSAGRARRNWPSGMIQGISNPARMACAVAKGPQHSVGDTAP